MTDLDEWRGDKQKVWRVEGNKIRQAFPFDDLAVSVGFTMSVDIDAKS